MYILGYTYQLIVMLPVLAWVNVTEFLTCRISNERWSKGREDAQSLLD